MNGILFLIPIALLMGLMGLAAFVWALKSGQFDDVEGDGMRILMDDKPEKPASDE